MKKLLACLLLAAGACTSAPAAPSRTLVAAFYPLAEAAERVGGDLVEVVNLTSPGSEPHDLELGPSDTATILDAALVLYLGRGFQPVLEDALDDREGPSIDLLEGFDQREGGTHGRAEDERAQDDAEHGDEELDPHVWLDPAAMIRIATRVRAALAGADVDNAGVYQANADAYIAELQALASEFSSGLASCESRTMVVSHAAFGYLADRFDLEQHAITGVSPDQEPSARRLAELAELVKDEGVTTVFTETLVDPSVAETLAGEAGVATAVLDPIEGLSAEQLAAGQDYASAMRANLDVLRTGLGCS